MQQESSMRFAKLSVLVLSTMLVCSSVSVASKGGGSSGASRGGSVGGSRGISSGGSSRGIQSLSKGIQSSSKGNMVLPARTTTNVINPRLVVTKVVTGQTVNTKTTRTTQVVPSQTTYVIPNRTTQVVVGKCCHCPQVVVTKCCHCPQVVCGIVCPIPIVSSFWGTLFGEVPVQYERWLRLHNDTPEKVTVYLRYHTQDLTGDWEWFPEAPVLGATQWIAFELQPGEVLDPTFLDVPIAANRIRIYVQSATRSWMTFAEEDFWLVPEVTPEGVHLYYDYTRQTFDFFINNIK
jgi:hypothetical protein